MAKRTAIAFSNVTKQFAEKNQKALVKSTFQIEEGEFITVLGSSGSGKTTTLKMMNRLIEPDSGTIEFYGKNLQEMDVIQLRRQMGYVVQQIGLFPHMTVAENIATVPQLLNWETSRIQTRIQELLALMQLPQDFAQQKPRQLSGGQQQRVGVARALAADPKVLLLDEPFGAIDAITRLGLQEEILKIHQQMPNKTFVFVTHDINEAFKLGTRILIMDQGEICQFDTPQNILQQPANTFVHKLIDAAKQQEIFWSGGL